MEDEKPNDGKVPKERQALVFVERCYEETLRLRRQSAETTVRSLMILPNGLLRSDQKRIGKYFAHVCKWSIVNDKFIDLRT
jgi:hypothetical protein